MRVGVRVRVKVRVRLGSGLGLGLGLDIRPATDGGPAPVRRGRLGPAITGPAVGLVDAGARAASVRVGGFGVDGAALLEHLVRVGVRVRVRVGVRRGVRMSVRARVRFRARFRGRIRVLLEHQVVEGVVHEAALAAHAARGVVLGQLHPRDAVDEVLLRERRHLG